MKYILWVCAITLFIFLYVLVGALGGDIARELPVEAIFFLFPIIAFLIIPFFRKKADMPSKRIGLLIWGFCSCFYCVAVTLNELSPWPDSPGSMLMPVVILCMIGTGLGIVLVFGIPQRLFVLGVRGLYRIGTWVKTGE